MIRPRMFVGSAAEALGMVDDLAERVSGFVDILPWTKTFIAGEGTVAALTRELNSVDLAAVFLSPHDAAEIREDIRSVPRDNTVFELGMAMALLGPESAFFIRPRGDSMLHLPSDTEGITPISYVPDHDDPMDYVAEQIELAVETRVRGVSGDWHQAWSGESDTFDETNAGPAEVLQVGQRVRAEWSTQGLNYGFVGNRHGGYLTGRWFDRDESDSYSGAFQLRVDGGRRSMKGHWCGYRNNGTIGDGDWEWVKTG